MKRKVGSSKKMSAVNSLKRVRNTDIVSVKLRRYEKIVYNNLPSNGGNGLDEYVLNVMKLS